MFTAGEPSAVQSVASTSADEPADVAIIPPPLLRHKLMQSIEAEREVSYDKVYIISESQLQKLASVIKCPDCGGGDEQVAPSETRTLSA